MVEYFVLIAFTVWLVLCNSNAGIIIKRNKIILETYVVLQWKNSCSCNVENL